jgi:hypothetical protein
VPLQYLDVGVLSEGHARARFSARRRGKSYGTIEPF